MRDDDQELSEEKLTKFGLLMETAVAHQNLAEQALNRLKTYMQDMDGVVREEIRRTLVEEMQSLVGECKRATHAMNGVKRAANMRMATWGVLMALLCSGAATAIPMFVLPSKEQIAQLRAQHDQFAKRVAELEQRGGRIELQRCGDAGRLCARVDREAPAFGKKGDFLILKGY